MSILYIDCRMGMSAAKLLGALVDILERPELFIRRFNELGFKDLSIDRENEAENGITGSRILFKRENDNPNYNEYGEEAIKGKKEAHESVKFRTLQEVAAIIDDLPLSGKVRKRAISIYDNIAAAVAEAKNENADEVFLRRTGSKNIIAAIVGICMILEETEYEKIVVSSIAVGKGYAHTSRGKLPIPVPALQNLLEGMPYIPGTEERELCTYDGAAVLKNIADEFGELPEMTILRKGAGFGSSHMSSGVNCVRVYVGTPIVTAANAAVTELEAVLYGEGTGSLTLLGERLNGIGVKEAYTYPITSLGGKTGCVLKCICENDIADSAAGEILRNTSAEEVLRSTLAAYETEKSIRTVKTSLGEIAVEKTVGFGINEVKPIAEEVLESARENDLSYEEAYSIILKEI